MDYVMKIESNTFLDLEKFFSVPFLPPAPYNINILGGALRNKAFWDGKKGNTEKDAINRLQSFWGNEFDGVHLYMSGECYFFSSDLAKFVAEESMVRCCCLDTLHSMK